MGFCHSGLFCVDLTPLSSLASKVYFHSMDVENDFIIWHTRLEYIRDERMARLTRGG